MAAKKAPRSWEHQMGPDDYVKLLENLSPLDYHGLRAYFLSALPRATGAFNVLPDPMPLGQCLSLSGKILALRVQERPWLLQDTEYIYWPADAGREEGFTWFASKGMQETSTEGTDGPPGKLGMYLGEVLERKTRDEEWSSTWCHLIVELSPTFNAAVNSPVYAVREKQKEKPREQFGPPLPTPLMLSREPVVASVHILGELVRSANADQSKSTPHALEAFLRDEGASTLDEKYPYAPWIVRHKYLDPLGFETGALKRPAGVEENIYDASYWKSPVSDMMRTLAREKESTSKEPAPNPQDIHEHGGVSGWLHKIQAKMTGGSKPP